MCKAATKIKKVENYLRKIPTNNLHAQFPSNPSLVQANQYQHATASAIKSGAIVTANGAYMG